MPAELERIVEKALTKEKDERYQTVKDLGLDLKRLKQHLEMEAELERSITPEEGARRAGRPQGSRYKASAATPTAEGSAAHTLSSAEYIVSEIKQHKRGALAGCCRHS